MKRGSRKLTVQGANRSVMKNRQIRSVQAIWNCNKSHWAYSQSISRSSAVCYLQHSNWNCNCSCVSVCICHTAALVDVSMRISARFGGVCVSTCVCVRCDLRLCSRPVAICNFSPLTPLAPSFRASTSRAIACRNQHFEVSVFIPCIHTNTVVGSQIHSPSQYVKPPEELDEFWVLLAMGTSLDAVSGTWKLTLHVGGDGTPKILARSIKLLILETPSNYHCPDGTSSFTTRFR